MRYDTQVYVLHAVFLYTVQVWREPGVTLAINILLCTNINVNNILYLSNICAHLIAASQLDLMAGSSVVYNMGICPN